MPMNSKTGFVKSFMLTKKLAQQAGGKTFGSGERPTAAWTCEACGATNTPRREKCACGAKKPADPTPS